MVNDRILQYNYTPSNKLWLIEIHKKFIWHHYQLLLKRLSISIFKYYRNVIHFHRHRKINYCQWTCAVYYWIELNWNFLFPCFRFRYYSRSRIYYKEQYRGKWGPKNVANPCGFTFIGTHVLALQCISMEDKQTTVKKHCENSSNFQVTNIS